MVVCAPLPSQDPSLPFYRKAVQYISHFIPISDSSFSPSRPDPLCDKDQELSSTVAMRYLNRFYSLVGLAVCSILFSAWSLKTYRDRRSLTNSTKQEVTESSPSLVVFGDSWSDNSVVGHDTGRGQVWTEWLCSQVSEKKTNSDGRASLTDP